MPAVRTAEWINLLYFCLAGGLAFLVPLQRTRRIAILSIGVLGVGLVLAGQFAGRFLPPLAASVVRDWLPAPLILLAYHQGGRFFSRPMDRLQSALQEFDRRLFACLERSLGVCEVPGPVRTYFEIAYFFCYPLVPMGVGVLYVAHMRGRVDDFWAVVLPPAYLCYAMIPFLPTLPPWALDRGVTAGEDDGMRAANFFILRHLSIKANTFPSAHVAASIAAALALLEFVPSAGLVFLWIAVSIAVSTVTGRYHYTLDAVAGAALAAVTVAVTRLL